MPSYDSPHQVLAVPVQGCHGKVTHEVPSGHEGDHIHTCKESKHSISRFYRAHHMHDSAAWSWMLFLRQATPQHGMKHCTVVCNKLLTKSGLLPEGGHEGVWQASSCLVNVLDNLIVLPRRQLVL